MTTLCRQSTPCKSRVVQDFVWLSVQQRRSEVRCGGLAGCDSRAGVGPLEAQPRGGPESD
jgi:hypothetical protein